MYVCLGVAAVGDARKSGCNHTRLVNIERSLAFCLSEMEH